MKTKSKSKHFKIPTTFGRAKNENENIKIFFFSGIFFRFKVERGRKVGGVQLGGDGVRVRKEVNWHEGGDERKAAV